MLVEKSTQKQWKSMYECDRCGLKTEKKDRVGIYIQRDTETPKKYSDLCIKCFKALNRGIKKGRTNERIQEIGKKIN